jgi:hypothetical protein
LSDGEYLFASSGVRIYSLMMIEGSKLLLMQQNSTSKQGQT